ncbi:MAG: hypothetical protein ACT4NY_25700 [Pseudonocardiales bacterium]
MLNRDHSVVSREVARNGGGSAYRAISAQRRADERRARPKLRLLETNQRLHGEVNAGLELKWSPKRISERLRQGRTRRVSRSRAAVTRGRIPDMINTQ